MTGVLIKGENVDIDTRTWRGPGGDTGRDWGDTTVGLRTPNIASELETGREAWNRSSLQSS